MAIIKGLSRVLIVAGALSLPALAMAEQPTETCDGDKMKDPTAEKSDLKPSEDKASKRTDDKSAPKPDPKQPDQRS